MKIAVAMSGGVDSSVAAHLLKEQGYDICGITAIFHRHETNNQNNIKDAQEICNRLNIQHHVIDLHEKFNEYVIQPFCKSYLNGKTPSPCMQCNAVMKFPGLIEYARSLGCDKLATGHYAALEHENRYFIKQSNAQKKDQSYFLAFLSQHILSRIVFPLGELTKDRVREIALKNSLHTAQRSDSQEICFIPDDDYISFIESHGVEPADGEIVDAAGTVLGRHKGIHRYTIGQRRGMGISAERPLYVIEIEADANKIIAGYKEELLKKSLTATDINYMKTESCDDLDVYMMTRSTQKPFAAHLKETPQGITAYFDEPQAGISPGQGAVFYNKEGDVLAAGVIESSTA